MQASVSCSALWGYLGYCTIQNTSASAALSVDVLLRAEQNILGVGRSGVGGDEGKCGRGLEEET